MKQPSVYSSYVVLVDSEMFFKEFPQIRLMEDFLLRFSLVEEIEDKKMLSEVKKHSKELLKRMRKKYYLYKPFLD
jgi:hypothetical protein